jgi:hypothetical protein
LKSQRINDKHIENAYSLRRNMGRDIARPDSPKPLQKTTCCYAGLFAIAVVMPVVLLVLFSAPLRAAAQPAGQANIQLTDAEREWLVQHPRIQVGIMDAWPPLNYLEGDK